MAAAEKKVKKEKEIQAEFENQVKDVRQQLTDHFKCLDQKLETQTAIIFELQELFRRKSEVEIEYSKNLDKLFKQFQLRHKTDKQRREAWSAFSTFGCWQQLMNITKKESRDHGVLGELYGGALVAKLGEIADDLKRLFVRCRDVGSTCQDDIFKQFNEVQTAMKQYHVYHGESKLTEGKVKHLEEQRIKVEQQATKASKKVKALEAQVEKESSVFQESKLKTLTSRNDYLLAIEAANASLLKYHDDFNLLIDSSDFGYHNSMQRTMQTYASSLECLRTSHQQSCDSISKCIQGLDRNADRDSFRNLHSSVFVKPKRFEYQPHKGDEVCQLSAQKLVQDELVQRYQQLSKRIEGARVENDELWKSVEEVDRHLAAVIHAKDIDVVELFQSESTTAKSPTTNENRKRRMEMEAYYFQKLQELLMSNNLLLRVQARYSLLKKALGDTGDLAKGGAVHLTGSGNISSRPPSLPPKPAKARVVGNMPLVGQPKVFGCHLEEYLQLTGEDIPLVVRSCVRAINLYGMHHEGIFRISGLQAEINEIKANFEKGIDGLSSISDSNSVNSVAGVLKSFFRELREPMFPMHLFDPLVEAIRTTNTQEMVARLAELVKTLSRPRIIVARYLFSFLNHVSEYSDENLMYPYNLSICFGPTLLPIPPDKDQVAYQSNVNDVIKFMIVHHDKVFPNDGGPVYEKVLTDTHGGRDEADGSESEQGEGDDETADIVEAIALYDYEGRTARELSFKKGDTLILYSRTNAEWWEGACRGCEGAVPDKYITARRLEEHGTPHASVSSLSDIAVSPAGTMESLPRRIGSSSSSSGGTGSLASGGSAAAGNSREPSVSGNGSKSSSQLSLPQGTATIERPSSPFASPVAGGSSGAATPDESDLQSDRAQPTPSAAAAAAATACGTSSSVAGSGASSVQFRLHTAEVSTVSSVSNSAAGSRAAVAVDSMTSSLDEEQLGADVDSIMAEVVSDLQAMAASGSSAAAAAAAATGSAPSECSGGSSSSSSSADGSHQRILSASVAGTLCTADDKGDDDDYLGSIPPTSRTGASVSKANSLPRTVFSSGGTAALGRATSPAAAPAAAAGATPYMTDEPGRQMTSFRRGGSAREGQQSPAAAFSASGGSLPPSWAQARDPSGKANAGSATGGSGSGSMQQRPQPPASGAIGESSQQAGAAGSGKGRSSGEAPAVAAASGGMMALSVEQPPRATAGGDAGPAADVQSPTDGSGSIVTAGQQQEAGRKIPPPIPTKVKPSAASVAAALKQQQISGSTKKGDNSTLL